MAEQLMGLTDDRQCVPVGGKTSASQLNIQSSVGRGGRNSRPDVVKIQQALNRVPAHQGGPQPPLSVDGLVGPKTEGAIYRFQKHHFGAAKADARVDPGHRTLAKLREFQPQDQPGTPAVSGATVVLGLTSVSSLKSSPATVMQQVKASLPLALQWSLAARRRLAEAIGFTKGLATGGDFKRSHDLVDRCFKVKSLSASDAVSAMGAIDRIFAEMPKVIFADSVGKGVFHPAPSSGCNRPGKSVNAFTYTGGFHKIDPATGNPPMSNPEYSGPNVSQKGIYMCTAHIKNKNPFHMADLIVHEMAHFVGPTRKSPNAIKDHAGGLGALNSNHRTSMRTASNYAWLAWLARLPKSQWMTNKG